MIETFIEYCNFAFRFCLYLLDLGYELLRKENEEYEITSPNGYPNTYPNNAFEFWDIRAPTGYVIAVYIDSFEIQLSGVDYLHIGDRADYFHHNSREWIHLTGRKSDVLPYRHFSL